MIYDSAYLKQNDLPPIVIIGSGPAGISLAVKLAKQGIDSLILESGGDQWSDIAHDTMKGEVIGNHYFTLDASRLRFFGGSSNHWTGVCRYLDEVDFIKRDDIDGHIGWPIVKADLDPYRKETQDILEIGDITQHSISDKLEELQFLLSAPVRFATKYRDFFQKSDKAHICLNTNVLSLHAENGRVKRIQVSGHDKQPFFIEPNTVVVCTGGIDNSRLLLWSNEVSDQPVVANATTLGRYWHEHPHDEAGYAFVNKIFKTYRLPNWHIAFFSPKPELLKKYRILNTCFRLRTNPSDTETRLKKYICLGGPGEKENFDVMNKTIDCISSIEMVWEQETRYTNHIALSQTEKDGFGVPRPILHWTLSELDYRTPKVMMELFGQYLLENKLGYVQLNEHIVNEKDHPPIAWMAGCHHMGGTRMATSAKDGIVDANLKVFGMDNAYVLGSSVFPTGGHANPTATIVQLSLRLADHLSAIKVST